MKNKLLFQSCLFMMLPAFIFLKSNAQISFISNKQNVCAPTTVTFINTSTDTSAYRYQWTFGDGSPSVYDTLTTAISHTYNNAGNFYVQMTAYKSSGSYIGSANMTLTLLGAPATFYLSKNSACPNEKITVGSNGNFSSVLWDFGDGSTATGNNQDHIYDSTGSFVITVIITTTCGTDTLSKPITINGNLYIGSSVSLSMSPYTAILCPDENLNLSTSWGYLYYLWDYGDGNSDSTIYSSVGHKYADTGMYNVSVTIVNGCGNDTVLSGIVTVKNDLKITSSIFIQSPSTSCPYDNVQFNVNSGYYSYLWNFGDGATSNYYYSSHSYLDTGLYNVSMTLTNGCGNDTTVYKAIQVKNNLPFTGFVSLSAYPNPVCPGDKINLYTSSGYSSYTWNFGDGNSENSSSYTSHTYTTPGTKTVSITILNGCGNDTTKSTTVNVQNNVPFSGSLSVYAYPNPGCTGDSVRINAPGNYSTYLWDFNDGNTDSTSTSTHWHAFSPAGTYNVSVTVINGCGYDTLLTKEITTVDNGVYSIQDVNLQIGPDTVCPGDLVDFEMNGTGYASWNSALINFGDGNSEEYYHSSSNHLKHSFAVPNTYTASLTVTNSCGYDTTVYGTVVVQNGLNPDPNNYSVNANPYYTCLGSVTGFTIYGPKAGSYQWNFGDGATLTTDTFIASHTYLTSGTFAVSVTIQNSCGNSIVKTTTVTVDVCTGISYAINSQPGTAMIFPNPFSRTTTLYLQNFDDQKMNNLSLEIYDVLGQKIRSVSVSGEQTKISRDGIENGIYFLQLKNENEIIATHKIITY